MSDPLFQSAKDLLPGLVDLRRAIHQEPELGLHTPKTMEKVRAALDGLPLEFKTGPSTTGTIAILRGDAGGDRTILLRGDMDALPMPEQTGLPYASQIEGRMHACGHDAHTAMLVGAAKLLCARKASLPGTVLFMFQPGEEGHHGARYMIEDGLLDNPTPDTAFALHVMPNAPFGVIGGLVGPTLASADTFRVTVNGHGGHASMPHDAVDPVPVACAIVTALQTLVTRTVPISDPAVITVGKITAGTTDNVIPDTAELLGTIRCLSRDRRSTIKTALTNLAEHIAAAHNATADVEIEEGFPVTVSDHRGVALGESVVQSLFGPDAWLTMPSPIMGAEDFSYVLEKVPGAFFFIGAAQEGSDDWSSCCPIHSSHMVIDESVMARGATVHAGLAERFLATGFITPS